MNLRERINTAAHERDMDKIAKAVSESHRSVRYLLSMMYSLSPETRKISAKALILALEQYPAMQKKVIQQLIWAMSEESHTNAANGPEFIYEIAKKKPKFLLPVIPDLVRLSADKNLCKNLEKSIKLVREQFPGELGLRLSKRLNTQMKKGEMCGNAYNR